MARKVATPKDPNAKPNQGGAKCANCGGDIFYSIRAAGGVSGWLHDASCLVSCPKASR